MSGTAEGQAAGALRDMLLAGQEVMFDSIFLERMALWPAEKRSWPIDRRRGWLGKLRCGAKLENHMVWFLIDGAKVSPSVIETLSEMNEARISEKLLALDENQSIEDADELRRQLRTCRGKLSVARRDSVA